MDGEIVSTALMLCLDKVAINHNKEVAEAQHKGFQLLIDEAWKVAMRSQHYLTIRCLDRPSESVWMALYAFGDDRNFLNTTSLTRHVATCLSMRSAFSQLLQRFSQFYRMSSSSS
ncbi:hypothetical protein F441_15217 [Phytophthora nicotianae CJ01A1]|uniref:Uncharacterized protein n=1 Tax=Phytophthora nicotianae CJ01A1 TaxID=1317063 RepID=W2WFL2_PHYNI|nr:hypothetical protein F441_15217 [Phytophthora nicotianae CJ01A1]